MLGHKGYAFSGEHLTQEEKVCRNRSLGNYSDTFNLKEVARNTGPDGDLGKPFSLRVKRRCLASLLAPLLMVKGQRPSHLCAYVCMCFLNHVSQKKCFEDQGHLS